jgi:formylglycine-generating enzyme required for sulfatase activity
LSEDLNDYNTDTADEMIVEDICLDYGHLFGKEPNIIILRTERISVNERRKCYTQLSLDQLKEKVSIEMKEGFTPTNLTPGIGNTGDTNYNIILSNLSNNEFSYWINDEGANTRFHSRIDIAANPLRIMTGGSDEDARFCTIYRKDFSIESEQIISDGFIDRDVLDSKFSEGYRPITFTVRPCSGGGVESSVLLHRPMIPDELKESIAVRKARVAIALFLLGSDIEFKQSLKLTPDPRLRSYVIDFLPNYLDSPEDILHLLRDFRSTDLDVKRALILALGNYSTSGKTSPSFQSDLKDILLHLFMEDKDPGVHSASEWTLRQFGFHREVTGSIASLSVVGPDGHRDWYITRNGHMTFAVINPLTPFFLMGSPITEKHRYDHEHLHFRSMCRCLAISTKEVTLSQFREICGNVSPAKSNSDDSPIDSVTWQDAVRFCNRLSEIEGIASDQWCYQPDPVHADLLTLKPGFIELSGYRLPIDSEWEFACRAGSTTARYYGESDVLLSKYCVYSDNSRLISPFEVGSLIPNDFGLFDCLGNVSEWCQNASYLQYPYKSRSGSNESFLDEDEGKSSRRISGGSYSTPASRIRSASIFNYDPMLEVINTLGIGFRPVRTVRTVFKCD